MARISKKICAVYGKDAEKEHVCLRFARFHSEDLSLQDVRLSLPVKIDGDKDINRH